LVVGLKESTNASVLRSVRDAENACRVVQRRQG
jgi:hypothetical protein